MQTVHCARLVGFAADPRHETALSRLVPNGVHNASNDLATITRWWTAEPNAGIGVAVKPSGLVAIDIDPRNGGFETMERLRRSMGRWRPMCWPTPAAAASTGFSALNWWTTCRASSAKGSM